MKITDLSKLDVKDINVAKIKDQILERKEIAIQVLLGVVSFFVAVSMFNQSQGQIKQYKLKIASLQAKTGSIDQYNTTQTDVKDFLSKVPDPVSEDKIINLVTDLAGKNGVKIITFTQADVQKNNTMQITTLIFSLVADSFSGMVRFMADIENGKDFLQIWSCDVDPQINKKTSKNSGAMPINFRIEVASLKVEQAQ